jgi:hypothetical protein
VEPSRRKVWKWDDADSCVQRTVNPAASNGALPLLLSKSQVSTSATSSSWAGLGYNTTVLRILSISSEKDLVLSLRHCSISVSVVWNITLSYTKASLKRKHLRSHLISWCQFDFISGASCYLESGKFESKIILSTENLTNMSLKRSHYRPGRMVIFGESDSDDDEPQGVKRRVISKGIFTFFSHPYIL